MIELGEINFIYSYQNAQASQQSPPMQLAESLQAIPSKLSIGSMPDDISDSPFNSLTNCHNEYDIYSENNEGSISDLPTNQNLEQWDTKQSKPSIASLDERAKEIREHTERGEDLEPRPAKKRNGRAKMMSTFSRIANSACEKGDSPRRHSRTHEGKLKKQHEYINGLNERKCKLTAGIESTRSETAPSSANSRLIGPAIALKTAILNQNLNQIILRNHIK